MKTTPAEKADIRRDRVAVLASTIVRELASVRIHDIEREPTEKDDPPVVMTPRLKHLVDAYATSRRAMKLAEKGINDAGYRVEEHGCNASAKVTLAHPYRSRQVEKDLAKKRMAERCNKVRELRTNMLIDLVTLDEAKAKAVVSAFRIAVERI